MGEVLSFSKKKSSNAQKNSAPPQKSKISRAKTQEPQAVSAQDAWEAEAPKRTSLKPRTPKKKQALNSESIKVWWISQEFDDLIRKAVLDKHIPVEELAAVMAHRLGTLLMTSERTPELTLFCMKLISKITNQPHPGSNAS